MEVTSSQEKAALLIVDDDPDIRDALTDLLTHYGYDVTCAATGKEALREFRASTFHAVILDLGLPDLHGLVVLQQLVTDRPTVPVIVFTAVSDEAQKIETLKLGAYSFLTKPYNKELLQSVLIKALGRPPAFRLGSLSLSLSATIDGILHQGPGVIQVKDLEGRYVFVNQQWERLFHRSAAETIGQSVLDVFPRHIAETLRANDLYVQQTGKTLDVKETVIQDNATRVYRSLKFPLLDSSGAPYAVCGIATGVTD